MPDLRSDLIDKLKVLNTVWEDQANQRAIDAWLTNFADTGAGQPEEQEIHALYLLSRFMYFGRDQMRALLHALFRDLYKYRIIEQLRRANANTADETFLKTKFLEALKATRFLGVGNPSESGTHLLYYFRQENRLQSDLFINTHSIFDRAGGASPVLQYPSIKRYVFIDDFCGSGTQAEDYSKKIVEDIKRLDRSVEVSYYVLFATKHGLEYIRDNTVFDNVETVFELDDTYKCFHASSRYFVDPPASIQQAFAHTMAKHYGDQLKPDDPLGYKDGQLLIGFYHNTPDNTLPIIWYAEPNPPWSPMFRRYEKITYGGSP